MEEEPIQSVFLQQYESITSRGVLALYEEDHYCVGNHMLMEEHHIELNPVCKPGPMKSAGGPIPSCTLQTPGRYWP